MAPKSSQAGEPAKPFDSDGLVRLTEQAQAMDERDPRRITASLAMFERLAEHWSLRGDERETLLGGIPKSTWSEWRQRPGFARIKPDTRERVANLFTIDLNVHSLFAPEFADRWIREPNAAFEGESPLSRMLRGKVEDVITVRRYLERVASSTPGEAHHAGGAHPAQRLVVSNLPAIAVESDHASESQWQADLSMRVARAMISQDESFSAALLAHVAQIATQPFAYPRRSKVGNIRVVPMTHRGVTWDVRFEISEAKRTILITSVEPKRTG